jgi:hypothetical protein
MKFYLAEQNIGSNATKAQVEKVIELLKEKGWDVEYGLGKNKPTDMAEFGQEEKVVDAFADDFMRCVEQVEK